MYIANTFIHNEQVQYKIESNDLVKTDNIWIEVLKNKTKYIIGGIYIDIQIPLLLSFIRPLMSVLVKFHANSAHAWLLGT